MKTATELAAEYAFKYATDRNSAEFLKAFNSYLAGYVGAEQNGLRSNYNDHKLKEAQETIVKLKERLKLLSLEFSRIMETTEEVKDLFDGWKKTDLQFEHHDKVGPWARFFPVKKDDV
jgi:hypothetical protein